MKQILKSKLIFVFVVGAMLFGILGTLPMIVPAIASTSVGGNDYPWPNADMNSLSPLKFNYRNCTDYAAYEINEQMGGNTTNNIKFSWSSINYNSDGNAYAWKDGATGKWPIDTKPAVGSVAWWAAAPNNGNFGHVAIVASVSNNGNTIVVDEYNLAFTGVYGTRSLTNGVTDWPNYFIHIADITGSPSAYAGKIVQWKGDTKPQRTSWLVSPDLKRYWVPDSSTYNCLKSQGYPDAGPISSTLLNQLPDQNGKWATCGSPSLGVNQFLFRGSYLRSSNGLYFLQLQRSDGNLVLYGPSGALWANSRSSDYLIMQGDNNLVSYGYGVGATWATGTGGTGANTLVVTNDGNLDLISGGVRIWDSYHGRLVPGDCNFDGHVNSIDLSILLSHYGQAYYPCDFNVDGIVNITDLSILQSHYGT